MNLLRLAVMVTALAASLPAHAASSCTKSHEPDVVRIQLIGCGDPASIELRRNGDDKALMKATRVKEGGPWITTKPFTESIGSVFLCSRVCKFASVCAYGTPTPEIENGRAVCVAEYEFTCDEQAWTLAVQSKPSATLAYTRKRDTGREQRGELKAVPLGPAKVCDLASDETMSLTPRFTQPRPYTFTAIPISHEKLESRRKKQWILGRSELLEYVVMPGGKRALDMTEAERTFLQLDLKELNFGIAGDGVSP